MGRRHLAIGVVMLAILAYQVWAGGEVSDAREIVATADRPRDARVLPAVLARVAAFESDNDEADDEADDDFVEGVELVDNGAALDNVDDDGTLLDADGLTLQQRIEGTVAVLEDRLPAGRGAVQGRVHDTDNGEYLAGVTVVLTSPAMEGAQAAITDEDGFYAISELPPGSYLVTFYYLELTVERPGIEVVARAATPVYQQLAASRPYQPQVIVINDDFIENVEVISSYDGVGISFTGTGSMTNTYYVDGIDTTGLTFGDDPDDDNTPLTITNDTFQIETQIDETDAFQEIPE